MKEVLNVCLRAKRLVTNISPSGITNLTPILRVGSEYLELHKTFWTFSLPPVTKYLKRSPETCPTLFRPARGSHIERLAALYAHVYYIYEGGIIM